MDEHIPGILGGRQIFWCPGGDGYLPFCPQPTDPDDHYYCCMYFYLEVDKPSCCQYPINAGLVLDAISCISRIFSSLATLAACQNFCGLENAATIHYTEEIDLYLGAKAHTISRLAERWERAYITNYPIDLKEKGNTTTIVTRNSSFAIGHALGAMAKHLNWTRMALVHSDSFHTMANAISNTLIAEYDITIATIFPHHSDGGLNVMEHLARAVVFFGTFVDYTEFLLKAAETFTALSEFSIIFIDFYDVEPNRFYRLAANFALQHEKRAKLRILLRNTLLLTAPLNMMKIVDLLAAEYGVQKSIPFQETLLICDLLHAGLGLDEPKNRSYHGSLGHYYLSETGIVLPDYEIHWYDGTNQTLMATIFGVDPVGNMAMGIRDENSYWTSQVPPSLPVCGFDGGSCSNRLVYVAIACIGVVLAFPLTFAWYFNQ
ncbi:unnamed protein product, partial [Mesorhabditis spiculigera]